MSDTSPRTHSAWTRVAAPLARVPVWIVTVGILLIVAGARLWLIWHYGSDQPFHDQWVAEGMYLNWFDGNLEPPIFFYPHNEHRPALTRLLAMFEFWLNGQWDCRLQMVVNLAIYLGAVAVLVEFARRLLSPRAFAACAVVGVLLFSQPANFENALWGFQSQFYLLLLLGIAHVLGSTRERMDGLWFAAQFAGLLNLFTIAAGVVSAAAVFLFSALEWWRGKRDTRTIATLSVSIALMALALLIYPGGSLPNDHRASSLPQFVAAFAHLAAWPVSSLLGCVLALPWIAFAARCARASFVEPNERRLLALGLWCALLVAAFAYGRGSAPGVIAVRYYDVLTMGLFVNLTALGWWMSRAVKARSIALLAVIVWGAMLGAGYARLNRPAELRWILGEWREQFVRQEAAIREFLVTDDDHALTRDPQVRAFMPHLEFTRDSLRDPRLRFRLPPNLVPRLPLVRDDDRSIGFSMPTAEDNIRPNPDVAGEQVFVSLPIERVGLPVLRFRVNGHLGPGGARLQLARADGTLIDPLGGNIADARPARTLNFFPGDGPVRVIARAAAASDFSFSAPIEVGLFSWLVPKFLSASVPVFFAGVVCFSIGTWVAARSRRGVVE